MWEFPHSLTCSCVIDSRDRSEGTITMTISIAAMKRILVSALSLCACALIAILVVWRHGAAQAPAVSQIANGQLAFHEVGRLVVDSTGSAQMIGYFPYIANLPVSFFSGTPSEATAYFTLRSSPFQIQSVSNGNVTAMFSQSAGGSAATVYSLYYNAAPYGDFTNPATFSGGQLIATFSSGPWMATASATGALLSGTSTLTSSADFIIKGQTFNLAALGDQETTVLTFGPSPTGGLTGGPLAISYGGYGLAATEANFRGARTRR